MYLIKQFNKMKRILLGMAATVAFSAVGFGQGAPENWFNLDQGKDGVQGVSTEKMYETILKDRKGVEVIVAVIDSGVDYEHEDLKNVMWVNPGEIAGNGKDDDGNGYIDDVHGWNFIGGKDGNVNDETLEIARLYKMYSLKYGDSDGTDLKGKKAKADFARWQKIKKELDEGRAQSQANLDRYTMLVETTKKVMKMVGKDTIEVADLKAIDSDDENVTRIVSILSNVIGDGGQPQDLIDQLQGGIDYFKGSLDFNNNPDFESRGIVGDNYDNQTEKYYGNADCKGPDSFHGTHVAGIIAAQRDNDLGIKGVANNVKIMSIRAVPNGDERDKDVANAIYYAVDNGASIINMSFGKGYSWNKKIVDDAMKYAAKNDVLLVHAAGNSSQDNDNTDNFPNDNYKKKGLFGKKQVPTWMEVGALSYKGGEDAPATFTNYGQTNVDIFAPGVQIYSTTPEQGYGNASGTSMACPVTAGVAAVLRSNFPDLTAVQVKSIMMDSVVPLNQDVKLPGSDKKVPFKTLSVTGGVVNVEKAVKKAETTKGKKKGVKRPKKDQA